jgi:hypothetical protein
MGTSFVRIYNRFLGRITDDMYVELTPEDTIRDLRSLLIDAIPSFEFPRKNISDFTIESIFVKEEDVSPGDFVIKLIEKEDEENEIFFEACIEHSYFSVDLTEEEINILAILMMNGWLQRQITSIENIRMKYSGSDFKFTSQANHLAKLLNLLEETQRQSHHLQRLYKRRKTDNSGNISSNWSVFRQVSAIDD